MIARDWRTRGSHNSPRVSPRTAHKKVINMNRRIWSAIGLCGWCFVALSSPSLAQDNWGAKMFDRLEVDFGAVAKGAEVKQYVKLRNLYQEDIRITSAQTSCACFRASVVDNATVIPSGKTAVIELGINTLNYQKKRDATLTVHLLEPIRGSSAEVRVPLKAYIRVDVVCTPGAVNFGTVDVGAGARQQVVKIAYAGRNDWKIQSVKSTNPNISTELKETARGNNLVHYDLYVDLKPDTPAGVIREPVDARHR